MEDRLTPTSVAGLADVVEVSVGLFHTCARRTSGAVVCWGENTSGVLGDGTITRRLVPTPVSDLTDALEIAAGGAHSCARRGSGVVVCWGLNDRGQIGDGSTAERLVPASVVGSIDAVEIAVGHLHSCARRSAGDVVCWGHNARGQLGDGSTTTDHLVPTIVAGLTDAIEVSAGAAHTCARRTSGMVACWGGNDYGQTGDGDVSSGRSALALVAGISDAVELAAGGRHTCVRRRSGAVVCWGGNGSGQVGDGTTSRHRPTPTPVSGLTDAVEISAGLAHTCARRSAGAIVCWGDNEFGQLGDGTTIDRFAPTPVLGL